jgi:hypothetical protein
MAKLSGVHVRSIADKVGFDGGDLRGYSSLVVGGGVSR